MGSGLVSKARGAATSKLQGVELGGTKAMFVTGGGKTCSGF